MYYDSNQDAVIVNSKNHTSFTPGFGRCCFYNDYPFFFSVNGGYYSWRNTLDGDLASAPKSIGAASDFITCQVKQLGDYLVVAGYDSQGTVLYYAKGSPDSLIWACNRISAQASVPTGLAYQKTTSTAPGLYFMTYSEKDYDTGYLNSGPVFWVADDISKGVSGITIDGVTSIYNHISRGLAIDSGLYLVCATDNYVDGVSLSDAGRYVFYTTINAVN